MLQKNYCLNDIPKLLKFIYLTFSNTKNYIRYHRQKVFQANLFAAECPPGRFGLDCRKRCSNNCVNSEPCDHVSGVCFNGCQDGFVGTSCNNSKTKV